jgi:hypothetical protein
MTVMFDILLAIRTATVSGPRPDYCGGRCLLTGWTGLSGRQHGPPRGRPRRWISPASVGSAQKLLAVHKLDGDQVSRREPGGTQ